MGNRFDLMSPEEISLVRGLEKKYNLTKEEALLDLIAEVSTNAITHGLSKPYIEEIKSVLSNK